MTYSGREEIETLYGAPFLAAILPDLEAAEEPELVEKAEAAIAAAGIYAASEIDTYLGVRYRLPLATVPPFLVQISVDVSVYRLANTHDRLTEEITERYKRAVAWLKDVSAGKASLGAAEPVSRVTGADGPTGAVAFGKPPRGF